MTEEELMQKFSDIFQNAFPASEVASYKQLSKPEETFQWLEIKMRDGRKLYFHYYGKLWKLMNY